MSCDLSYLKSLMKKCIRKGSRYADEFIENGNQWLLDKITEKEELDMEELIDSCNSIEELIVIWSFHMYQRGYYLFKAEEDDKKIANYIR